MEKIILDVRNPDELASEHIIDSFDIPLWILEIKTKSISEFLKWKEILIMCRSWKRAEYAKNLLKIYLDEKKLKVYEWWIIRYQKENPDNVVVNKKVAKISLIRQFQIIVWFLVLLWLILWLTLNPLFFIISWFVWLWVLFAWITLSAQCLEL